MRVIKRLYWFVLKSFLPLFAMTFFIVLFIVLMQFLWRYIDDLVGKGLSIGVLGELFFYAAVSMVPMALPLAILLASLMTFGNLGERSELTAIKASGVSLVKTMSPLIIFISFIAVGAFFFQNDLLPKAQVKMWTLLFSARQKSPELEIPEGAFYDQIPGYNLYVKSKNRETGMLHDVMIYDVSRGGDNSTILLADSARLAFTNDMRYLYLHLYEGEQFENLREQRSMDRNVPFRREAFFDKEILIPFDANFNKLDEGGMRNQYVGKNIAQLRVAIDSLHNRVDSLGAATESRFRGVAFPNLMGDGRRAVMFDSPTAFGPPGQRPESRPSSLPPRPSETSTPRPSSLPARPLDLDSLIQSMSPAQRDGLYATAGNMLQQRATDLEFRALEIGDEKNRVRRNEIELLKKFTLSIACIIFLFIGAPLGAIIRKGGLGTPLVISVLLFLVYYIIDNTGYKMARDGHWIVWCGIWLSTFVLLPLGIFVTYKAMNDSAVFNPDAYREWIRRIFGLPESHHLTKKEVIIEEIDTPRAVALASEIAAECGEWLSTHASRPKYTDYWLRGYDSAQLDGVGEKIDELCHTVSDSRSLRVIDTANKYPVVRSLWILNPVHPMWARRALMWFLPLGALVWLFALPYTRRIRREMARSQTASETMLQLLTDTPENKA